MTELRDIGEASFGSFAETVHGPDDQRSNYKYIGVSLAGSCVPSDYGCGIIHYGSVSAGSSAPHAYDRRACVYIKSSGVPGRGGWVKRVNVMPGRNVSTLPYGSVTSMNFRSVQAWINNGDPHYDYGAIIRTNLGNTVGWFGFGAYTDSDLLSAVGNISGYPGDKPAGTQWYDSRRIASVHLSMAACGLVFSRMITFEAMPHAILQSISFSHP
jgi:hypothetical protein